MLQFPQFKIINKHLIKNVKIPIITYQTEEKSHETFKIINGLKQKLEIMKNDVFVY